MQHVTWHSAESESFVEAGSVSGSKRARGAAELRRTATYGGGGDGSEERHARAARESVAARAAAYRVQSKGSPALAGRSRALSGAEVAARGAAGGGRGQKLERLSVDLSAHSNDEELREVRHAQTRDRNLRWSCSCSTEPWFS